MKIAVFGLGYVGAVTAACLAEKGNSVIGVDINQKKVDILNKGHSPVIEPGLARIIKRAVKDKRLMATVSSEDAVLKTDICMVCVGTPSDESGAIELGHLKKAVGQIGDALRCSNRFHTIVIRSTVLPGVTEDILIPILEAASGKKAGKGFGICVNPEFMREGNSLEDFYNPAKTIIGARSEKEMVVLKKVYSFLKAPFIATDIKTAEFSKYI